MCQALRLEELSVHRPRGVFYVPLSTDFDGVPVHQPREPEALCRVAPCVLALPSRATFLTCPVDVSGRLGHMPKLGSDPGWSWTEMRRCDCTQHWAGAVREGSGVSPHLLLVGCRFLECLGMGLSCDLQYPVRILASCVWCDLMR